MIQAVIFDNDGLLVDSEPVWEDARLEMAAEVGAEWNEDDKRAVMGVGTREWTAYMIERMGLDLTPEQVVERMVERMAAMYHAGVPFLPGAVEAVALAGQHVPTAVASGSHPDLLAVIMQHPAMQGRFQTVISADNVGAGKPAPDVYLAAARALGVEPGRCLVLEDSANGILAGKAAGMTVIAVPDARFPPLPEALAQADFVLDSLHEFPALFKRLRESDATL